MLNELFPADCFTNLSSHLLGSFIHTRDLLISCSSNVLCTEHSAQDAPLAFDALHLLKTPHLLIIKDQLKIALPFLPLLHRKPYCLLIYILPGSSYTAQLNHVALYISYLFMRVPPTT